MERIKRRRLNRDNEMNVIRMTHVPLENYYSVLSIDAQLIMEYVKVIDNKNIVTEDMIEQILKREYVIRLDDNKITTYGVFKRGKILFIENNRYYVLNMLKNTIREYELQHGELIDERLSFILTIRPMEIFTSDMDRSLRRMVDHTDVILRVGIPYRLKELCDEIGVFEDMDMDNIPRKLFQNHSIINMSVLNYLNYLTDNSPISSVNTCITDVGQKYYQKRIRKMDYKRHIIMHERGMHEKYEKKYREIPKEWKNISIVLKEIPIIEQHVHELIMKYNYIEDLIAWCNHRERKYDEKYPTQENMYEEWEEYKNRVLKYVSEDIKIDIERGGYILPKGMHSDDRCLFSNALCRMYTNEEVSKICLSIRKRKEIYIANVLDYFGKYFKNVNKIYLMKLIVELARRDYYQCDYGTHLSKIDFPNGVKLNGIYTPGYKPFYGEWTSKGLFLTGRNSSGKSQMMRTYLVNQMLCQLGKKTYGYMETRLYNRFYVKNIIHDYIVNGQGLYSEELIMSDYLKDVDENGLVIVDEAFSNVRTNITLDYLEKFMMCIRGMMLVVTHVSLRKPMTQLNANYELEPFNINSYNTMELLKKYGIL